VRRFFTAEDVGPAGEAELGARRVVRAAASAEDRTASGLELPCHLSRRGTEGAAESEAEPGSESGPEEPRTASFVARGGLERVKGPHLLVGVSHDLHLGPLRQGFLEFLHGGILFRHVDGVHEKVHRFDAVVGEDSADALFHVFGDLVEIGVHLENADVLLDQVGGDQILHFGEKHSAEEALESALVEGGNGADEFHQKLAGVLDAHAELPVGPHGNEDTV